MSDQSALGNSLISESVASTSEHSEQTRAEKIELRKRYRALIKETQANKEDLIKPDNNGLMENMAKANELFQKVTEAREAALDARFMSLAVSLGAQKTNMLQTDLVAFQPDEFIQKLATLMGGAVSSENTDDIIIPDSGWDVLGRKVETSFSSIVPALHHLSGAFDSSEQPVKQQRLNRNSEETSGKTQLPRQVTNYRDNQKEATPEEIERVFNIIRRIYKLDPFPIDYFELVINPDSFGHTIENIFHLAFLVKDGLVRISLNSNGLPVVEPIADVDKATAHRNSAGTRDRNDCSQVMVSLSMDEWEAIIDAYQLKGKQPYIQPSDRSAN